jgi:hypothetical protein
LSLVAAPTVTRRFLGGGVGARVCGGRWASPRDDREEKEATWFDLVGSADWVSAKVRFLGGVLRVVVVAAAAWGNVAAYSRADSDR